MIIDFKNKKEIRNKEEFMENLDRYNVLLDAFINEELKTETGIDVSALAISCSEIVGDCLHLLKKNGALDENILKLVIINIFDDEREV